MCFGFCFFDFIVGVKEEYVKSGINKYRRFLFWAAIAVAFPLLCAILFSNGPWFAETILSAMLKLSIFALWISIILLPPFFFFQKTGKLAAYITESAYFLFALTLWFMSVKITYWTLGPIVAVVGLFALGLGCIPFSLIITWYFKMWIDLEILGVLVLLCVLCRTTAHLYFTSNIRETEE